VREMIRLAYKTQQDKHSRLLCLSGSEEKNLNMSFTPCWQIGQKTLDGLFQCPGTFPTEPVPE